MRKEKWHTEERCITVLQELDYLEELELLEQAVLREDYEIIPERIQNLKQLFNQN